MLVFLMITTCIQAQTQVSLIETKCWKNDSSVFKVVGNVNEKEPHYQITENNNSIPLRAGWPVKVGFFPQHPLAVDLTGDGKKEVVVADGDGWLYVFNTYGQNLSGDWPKKLGNALSSPAIADIDQDGELEIIVVAKSDWEKNWPNGWVHVLKINGEYVPGWPYMLDGSHRWSNSVSIGDINQDGAFNIITATGCSFGSEQVTIHYDKLYAFYGNGSLLENWPLRPDSGSGLSRVPRSPLVLVNLNQDSCLEVVSGFFSKEKPGENVHAVYAVNSGGNTLTGFPVITDYWNWVLASADKDNDGFYEIYCHGQKYDRFGNKDTSWKTQDGVISLLAFADVNGNGYPELIYDSGAVHVVDRYGNELPGWPQYTRPGGDIVDGNPIAGDIDGDGDIEILIGSYYTTQIFAWHHDGTLVSGFPLNTGGTNDHITISDLDGDGDIELISACFDGLVYVWDIPSTGPCEKMEWPMYQRDQYRTGTYPSKHGTPVIEEPGKKARSFRLEQNYPNPFNSQTTIRFHLETGINRLSLHLFNVRGELIRTLSENRIFASGSHEILWDGKNKDGVDVPSGLYLVVMRDGVKKAMRKVLLVR